MNEKKFTPGPWVTDELPRNIGSVYAQDSLGSMIVRKPDMKYLFVSRTEEELKANANLIAAAPELFEALEFMVANIGQPVAMETIDGFDKAKLVIKKALGTSK